MFRKLFGTDGIRGEFGKIITPELAYEIGKATALVFQRENSNNTIIVGRDTRLSGFTLENSLISGITAMGTNVVKLGIVPTAVVPFSIPFHKACGAIMITASHNPASNNGFKFFNGNGLRISKEQENKIENLIALSKKQNVVTYNKLGSVVESKKSVNEYVKMVKKDIVPQAQNLKICLDCANGASYQISKKIFKNCNCKFIFSKPNGININENCGAIFLSGIKEEMKKGNYDLGFAFDGDADRVMVVLNNGKTVSGEEIIYNITKHNSYKSIVTTKMSNMALSMQLEKDEIECNIVDIGESEVIEGLLKTKSVFGGENNGHYLLLEKGTSSDGLVACAQIISIYSKNKTLCAPFNMFSTFETSIRVSNKSEVMASNELEHKIELCESLLEEKGRILVRASGTEEVIRVLVEGENEKLVNEIGNTLKETILKL